MLERSANFEIDGWRLALTARFEIETNLLTLIETGQAGLLHGGNVDEDISASLLPLDEAKALLGIEPFDGANGHDVPPSHNSVKAIGIEPGCHCRWSVEFFPCLASPIGFTFAAMNGRRVEDTIDPIIRTLLAGAPRSDGSTGRYHASGLFPYFARVDAA